MRAVLDANVFASALIRPEGPPGLILNRLLRDRAFELVLSPGVLKEIRRITFYPRVRLRVGLSDRELRRWIEMLPLLAIIVEGKVRDRVVRADPEDDKYIAVAQEGLAQFIVSGDRHLLELAEYEGIRIVSPRAFLRELSG